MAGAFAAAAPQAVAATSQPAGGSSVSDPYSPAYHHAYRHGVVPTLGQNAKMKSWAAAQPTPNVATGPETLSYGGGIDGIGVQSGHSKVYLVFYGTQWGTQGTDAQRQRDVLRRPGRRRARRPADVQGHRHRQRALVGRPHPVVRRPERGDRRDQLPARTPSFVPYQSGGVLAGVWYDNSAASPATASGHQLGAEAVKAAAHFGNTTAASNRYAYYVILSPHGTNPDNYQGPGTARGTTTTVTAR